jgi:cell volume regulation protein A
MKLRRRFYISWVGLRGAVPIVFATYPLLAGIDKANMIFNIVFFISVTSVLIQGTTLPVVARWLHVALPEKVKPISEIEKFIAEIPKSTLREFDILPDYFAVDKRIIDLNFPKTAFIVMIKRNNEYMRPGGSTLVQAHDTLMILADKNEVFIKVENCLNKPILPKQEK